MQYRMVRGHIPAFIWKILKRILDKRQLVLWERRGRSGSPPHIVKQRIIHEYHEKYPYDVFVETGTYLGEMVEAQKSRFRAVYSIELGLDLFKNAQRRFRRYANVKIIHGDSGEVLPALLAAMRHPAIFWLDGHFSAGITAKGPKECPVMEELQAILTEDCPPHVILIDDARCFNGQHDYPSLDELKEFVKVRNQNFRLEVNHDIIRILPNF